MAIGTYGQLRTQFKAVLNRRDCTDALADTFIDQGLSRVARVLRIPSMERIVLLDSNTAGEVAIPANLIELKHLIYVATGVKLIRKEYGDWLRLYTTQTAVVTTGAPVYYTRVGSEWFLKPNPGAVVGVVSCVYYGDPNTFDSDADTDPLIDIASDVIIYASLLFAADYFLDERRSSWEETYKMVLDEVLDSSASMEFHEGYMAVEPATSCEY